MVLAMAYMKAKSHGLRLRVCKYDGVISTFAKDPGVTCLNVEVVNGFVQRSWAD